MASHSATHRHGLSMHPALDIRCTDLKSTSDHQGIEWNVDMKAAHHANWNNQRVQPVCGCSVG